MIGYHGRENYGAEPLHGFCYWESLTDVDNSPLWHPRAYCSTLPDGTSKRPTVLIKYQTGARAMLVVTVRDSQSGGSVVPDLASATIEIEIIDLVSSKESFYQTVIGGFGNALSPLDGSADRMPELSALHAHSAVIPVQLDELIRSTYSAVNRNLYEARVTVRLPGSADAQHALPVATSVNLLHVLVQKLVVFVPGVMGSRIRVAAHRHEWAWPSESVIGVGVKPFAWLACDPYGNPMPGAEALELDLLSSVSGKDLVGWRPVSDINLACVYSVQNQPAMVCPSQHPRLYEITYQDAMRIDRVEVLHYIVQPWAYDWRLRLECAVDQMMASAPRQAHDPTVPPYRTPPSLSQVISDARTRYPFLAEKIALAGHSTGGLIMRGVLRRAGIDSLVDQAFFINVPFLGAPKTYYVFATGDFVPIVANDVIKHLAPNVPIFYYLSPTVHYPDPVLKETWATSHHLPCRRRPGHATSELVDPFIDELNTRCSAGLHHWNATLDTAADAYHDIIATKPIIGWDACKVFWNDRKEADTPGPVFVRSEAVTVHRGSNFIKSERWSPDRELIQGDGTVPSASQQGDAPVHIQIRNPDTSVVHDQAANQPFVWEHIASALRIPGPS